MSVRGRLDAAVARATAPFPGLTRWYAPWLARARGPRGDVPWAPFDRRFAESRAALVTTGGLRLDDQAPFDCDRGDPTFRAIPGDVDRARLRVDHTHYDTRHVRADPNVLFPLERLRELVAEGALGAVAPTHYGLMGYVPQVEALVEETAPAIAERMGRESVDFAILSPG